MTETTGEVRVRNVRTRQSESVVEQAVEFGGGIVRLGFSVFTLPLALLPSESRQHMQNATKELMYAFASLPGEFANIAGQAIEDWAGEKDDAPVASGKAPKDEMSAQ